MAVKLNCLIDEIDYLIPLDKGVDIVKIFNEIKEKLKVIKETKGFSQFIKIDRNFGHEAINTFFCDYPDDGIVFQLTIAYKQPGVVISVIYAWEEIDGT